MKGTNININMKKSAKIITVTNSFHFLNNKTELKRNNTTERVEDSRLLNIAYVKTIFIKAGARTTHVGRHSPVSPAAFVAKTVIVITANGMLSLILWFVTEQTCRTYVVPVLFNCVRRIS